MSFLKDFKSRLEGELDKKVPELNANIRDAAIPESVGEREKRAAWRFDFNILKSRPLVACVMALLIISVAIFPIMNALSADPAYASAVTVEVNPRVTFILDGEGKVSAVRAANSDADLIVSRPDFVAAVIGADAESAVWQFVDLTARLGFLDVSGEGAVKLSGFGPDGTEGLISDIREGLYARLRDDGIFAVIVDEIINEEKFAELNGIAASAADTILNSLGRFEALFGERGISSLSPEELSLRYESTVDRESIRDRLYASLEGSGILGISEALIPDTDDSEFFVGLISLIEFLDALGADTADLTDLISPPSTRDEYITKYSGSLTDRYEKRLNDTLPSYGSDRESIDKSAYDTRLDEIISEYGSLLEYWNNMKAE